MATSFSKAQDEESAENLILSLSKDG